MLQTISARWGSDSTTAEEGNAQPAQTAPYVEARLERGWSDRERWRASDAGPEVVERLPRAAPERSLRLEGLSLVREGGKSPKRIVATVVPGGSRMTKAVTQTTPIAIGISKDGDYKCSDAFGPSPGASMTERTSTSLTGPHALAEGGLVWFLGVSVASCMFGRTGPLIVIDDQFIVYVKGETTTVVPEASAGAVARLTRAGDAASRAELVLPVAPSSELSWTLVREERGRLCRTSVVDARLAEARRAKVVATLSKSPPPRAWSGFECAGPLSHERERFTSTTTFDLQGDGAAHAIELGRVHCGGLERGDPARWCPFQATLTSPSGKGRTLDAKLDDDTDRLLVLESKHGGCHDLLVEGPSPTLYRAAGTNTNACDYEAVTR